MIRALGRGLAAHVLAACVSAACASAWAGTLEGTAAYRERIALPPDAVFVVAHTDRDDTIRIISARLATPSERKIYEEG